MVDTVKHEKSEILVEVSYYDDKISQMFLMWIRVKLKMDCF